MNNKLKQICATLDSPLSEVLEKLNVSSNDGLPGGICLVVDHEGVLKGTITDGDVRRAFLNNKSFDLEAKDVMREDPIAFDEDYSYQEILDQLPQELTKRNRASNKFLGKLILVDSQRKPVKILNYHQLWEQRVATHRHVVVIGLGYVGLTLALVLADEGFMVTGVDIDEKRVNTLNSGESYVHEIGLHEMLREQIHKNFRATTEMPEGGDVFIISVGTPVKKDATGKTVLINDYLRDASELIGQHIKPGNLVILRSTVPIGTSRDFVAPIIERESGLKAGRDFHLSFAPERTAEGKAIQELRELPQLIGGINTDSVEATVALFRELTSMIVRVESLEAAEMAKLVNNTFRDVVFSYANHIAQIASHFNIDVVATINAANKGYPRDKVPLPSPGVGGPCLTKDPYIFASVAEKLEFDTTLFEHGRRINESMHEFVAASVIEQLEKSGKDPKEANILVCGLAFKGHPETGDIRNSTALDILELLRGRVKSISGHDPVATHEELREFNVEPVDLPTGFENKDAVLFLNNHRSYTKLDVYEMVRAMNEKPLVYDGWHLFRHQEILHAAPCTYMGISFTHSSI
ncbi:nucleotide sugar dehydrogenase [Rufibacter quisquiliarum]|uniref:Nucleotide sugar dehydrogenase n=1 Tax=Rufibacter quisquiliarum TaxID=1549639 RepID=A0A839GBN2_9BACT|nr:nucleotide sugar dehydrogenase [Rufibacter quisquiliarum]MBA9076974.1 nucleotide sugar dehydrogenase [Rufibacter quisquiliarum]